jgi:hypothetical protein
MLYPEVEFLASKLMLGALLDELRSRYGSYELVEHWSQGEFHHDVVLRVETAADLPGRVLVVATNCNGGIKEVLVVDRVPDRGGLWKLRCPENREFAGVPPTVLARSVTAHWFDPCELLVDDARSEYRAECRVRQTGGGWTFAIRKS